MPEGGITTHGSGFGDLFYYVFNRFRGALDISLDIIKSMRGNRFDAPEKACISRFSGFIF